MAAPHEELPANPEEFMDGDDDAEEPFLGDGRRTMRKGRVVWMEPPQGVLAMVVVMVSSPLLCYRQLWRLLLDPLVPKTLSLWQCRGCLSHTMRCRRRKSRRGRQRRTGGVVRRRGRARARVRDADHNVAADICRVSLLARSLQRFGCWVAGRRLGAFACAPARPAASAVRAEESQACEGEA